MRRVLVARQVLKVKLLMEMLPLMGKRVVSRSRLGTPARQHNV